MTSRVSWPQAGAVAAGGALGAAARYGVSAAWPAPPAGFPWATLLINLTGCFAIGLLLGPLGEPPRRGPVLRAFVGTGMLGGFTTFSTYALQGEQLWRADRYWSAFGYVTLTLVGALAAARFGVALARRWS